MFELYYTQSHTITICSLQIPYDIGLAAGIRVGNMLGAGEPDKAKKTSIVAFSFVGKNEIIKIYC